MSVRVNKVVDSVSYSAGAGQYILIPATHKWSKGRSLHIKKVSGDGTLDVHPIEFSVDGVNYFTVWSTDGAALNSANAEATNQSSYAFNLTNNFPYARLKVDVNTNSVVLSVVVAYID
jgi:hypothetical protein